MDVDMSSFGAAIASARKAKGWNQKELATKILKEEDEQPITPQYLNDIEHNRRSPTSDFLIRQFARVLGIDADALYGLSGLLPEPERKLVKKSTATDVSLAFQAFRRTLKGS